MANPLLLKPRLEQAVIDGLKTQTRRVIKHPVADITRPGLPRRWQVQVGEGEMARFESHSTGRLIESFAQYAQGERLWVRTRWAAPVEFDNLKPSLIPPDAPIYYGTPVAGGGWGKARPSIFMPRWASRVNVLITGVRVEFLQAISPADALAEGIGPGADPVARFKKLWNGINAKRGYSWEVNPAVFVYEFRKVD